MADDKIAELANALINEAANRLLLVPGTRGVFITLISEDMDMPLGTCTFGEDATVRDIVLAMRKANDSNEVLLKMLMSHLDGSSGEREDSADLGESSDDEAVTDTGSGPGSSQAVGESTPESGAESQPS